MKNLKYLLTFCFLALAPAAWAYEYPLQFTPNPGYRGLIVAGYEIDGSAIVGNCSYYTVHSGSGRGGGYHQYITHYDQGCKWDLFGNLLSVTPGAPVVPKPMYVNGTETVYGHNASGGYTGTDTRLPRGGFVNTQGSHYSWVTSNAYMLLQQQIYTFTLTLKSDGDLPLIITAVDASAMLAKANVKSTTCTGKTAVGSTCSVTVKYDTTVLNSDVDQSFDYDTLTVGVISNAGQANHFVQSYTITLNQANN